MLVQTARGNTPLNNPAGPSCFSINLIPMNILSVSNFIAPALAAGVVDGEEVEMSRVAVLYAIDEGPRTAWLVGWV